MVFRECWTKYRLKYGWENYLDKQRERDFSSLSNEQDW